jgi:hypothetical protein
MALTTRGLVSGVASSGQRAGLHARMLAIVACVVVLAPGGPAGVGAQAPAGQAQASRYIDAVPPDPNDRAGWTSMFDGRTLTGWDGPRELWRVEDEAIVVQSVAEPPTGPAYLIWEGGEPANFEFYWDLKLEGDGANSGVQFRATRLGEVAGQPRTRWETRGYQADVDNANSNTGALIECCRGPRRGVPPRSDRAFRGQVVRTAVAEGRPPTLLAAFDDAARLATFWRPGEWNRLYLIARDRMMTFFINGQLMSVLIDDHPTMFVARGVLAIQLEGRGANKASFRNLYIRELP